VKRKRTGKYEVTAAGGESVLAFVPDPLPPAPSLQLGGPLHSALEQALLSLGRLDTAAALLPDATLFLYSYVRKEAVLSSQIEGTQSSLSELLLFEHEDAPGAPRADIVEVSRYVAAMERGLSRIRSGFPISNRLIREIHGVLLSEGRGSRKDPGNFRRSQNWIGGTRPGAAVFVPPPPHAVEDCMSHLEKFIHEKEPSLPILVKAGLAHVQFETIHPFLDGNGRVGRLLITFLLCQAKVLREPLLYLSLYFKQNRDEYYRLLGQVRTAGDWEAWLQFFLEGVRQAADSAVTTARRLMGLFEADQIRIQTRGRLAGSALRVHEAMKRRPIVSLQDVVRSTGLSFPAVSKGMSLLEELGIARELTGRKRSRLYAYDAYIGILNEGTESP
jgi:Fic family protein